MSSNTIKVIVSFDNENKPAEFNFVSKKFNWENLVTLIQCISCLDPVVLYYYNLVEKRLASIENQDQLAELLNSVDQVDTTTTTTTLRFYGNKEQSIKEPPTALEGDAFGRLNVLVTQHKQVVRSSRHLARWIGILASMIAVAENGEAFEHEFQLLEEMLENKKESRRHRSTTDDNEHESNGGDPRPQAFFGRDFGGFHHGGHHRGGPFGMSSPLHHAGGRGGHHSRGRGGHHSFGGRGGHHSFGGRGGGAHHHHHLGGFGRHGSFSGPEFFGMHCNPFEEFDGAHRHCGGRERAGLFHTRDKGCKKFKFGHGHFAGVSSSSESEDSCDVAKEPLRKKDIKRLRRLHHHYGHHGRDFRFAA
jgi:hypothetical protein